MSDSDRRSAVDDHPPILYDTDSGEWFYVRSNLASTFEAALQVAKTAGAINDPEGWENGGVVHMRSAPTVHDPLWHAECSEAEAEVSYWKLMM
jgi:hypothetical protein